MDSDILEGGIVANNRIMCSAWIAIETKTRRGQMMLIRLPAKYELMSGAVTKIPQIIYEQGGRRVVPYGIYQVLLRVLQY
jgi:hypothetical protein